MTLKQLSKTLLFSLVFTGYGIFSVTPSAIAEGVTAQDTLKPSSWTSTQPYFNQAGHKLGFGVLNVASGWLSLLHEPTRPGGFFRGFARGMAYSIIYTGGGAIHAVTFPIPVDLPLPRGGISFEK